MSLVARFECPSISRVRRGLCGATKEGSSRTNGPADERSLVLRQNEGNGSHREEWITQKVADLPPFPDHAAVDPAQNSREEAAKAAAIKGRLRRGCSGWLISRPFFSVWRIDRAADRAVRLEKDHERRRLLREDRQVSLPQDHAAERPSSGDNRPHGRRGRRARRSHARVVSRLGLGGGLHGPSLVRDDRATSA